jgi:pteridine reductase
MQKEPKKTKASTPAVALITGAAKRIGAEIAKSLHKNGMNVVLHYNSSREAAEKLCASLNKNRKNSATLIRADLQNVPSLETLIEQSVATWGRLDVLVNNASRFYKTSIGKISEYSWDDLMNTNVKGPLFLSQAAAPHLKRTQGCIVNIGDIHAERPMRDYAVYCISKAGLIMLTKQLAKELGPEIRVNAVSPGPVLWPEGENALSEASKKNIIERTALQRHGEPDFVAKAVLYLVKDAEYVTGSIIAIDGGRLLCI